MQMSHAVAKTLIETSATVEEADKFIEKQYGFKTIREKIAFLKGMFDVEIVGHEEDDPDVMTYAAMLATIITT